MNEDLCRSRGFAHTLKPKTADTARQLWDVAAAGSLTLRQALDLCRRCNDLIPFTFSSEKTFVSVGLSLVDDLLRRLSPEAPVEAQILRNTVSQYVTGQIGEKELQKVFRHLEPLWVRSRALNAVPATVSALQSLVS